jgi:hypothetical protein
MRKITEEEICSTISKYKTLYDLRTGDYSLYRLIQNRKLMHLLDGLSRERVTRKKENKKPAKQYPVKKVERVKGIYGIWDPKIVDDIWHCGRCEENAKKHSIYPKLCVKCANFFIVTRRTGADSNLHNVKDEFCNINITIDGETRYVGLKAEGDLRIWLLKNGYGFILK